MVNAGYVGRDQATVKAHIEEMRRLGNPAPTSVPVFFMLTADNVTTADQIDVLGTGTSGEVEYVLLLHEDEVFVAVGSDHTDRALEGASIGKSKQVCKNVVSAPPSGLLRCERRLGRHAPHKLGGSPRYRP